ncbi:uncharacterized protein LOC130051577 [Ostrea edulis]|uniref:uncharacterized protein LOC130051577 n=1 Tax=Ostrea edulis TaxID=37623 RepID=UPI0024AFE981|nr:uncharacterized protein LOC130051577 [Ostrea edulis]
MAKKAGKQTITSIFNEAKRLHNKKGVDEHLIRNAEAEFEELTKYARDIEKNNPSRHKQIKDDVEMMEARKIRSMPSINGGGNLHKFLDSQASLDSGVWKNFFFLIECRKYVNEHSVKNGSKSGGNPRKQSNPSNHTGKYSPTTVKQHQRVTSFPSQNQRSTPTNSYPKHTVTYNTVVTGKYSPTTFKQPHLRVTSFPSQNQKPSQSPENVLHKGTRHQISEQEIVNGETSPRQPKIDVDHAKVIKENSLLKTTICEQKQQIEDLTTRLSKYASHQLTKGNPNIADLSDKNRPTKIGEKFSMLYDDQWSDAFEALKASGKKEEVVVKDLAVLVKECYSFCEEAKVKMAYELQRTVEDPFHLSMSSEGQKDIPLKGWDNIFRDILKAHGEQSVKSLQLAFRRQKERHTLDKRIVEYMDSLVELTWYMVIQDPPMSLQFINNGEKMDEKVFKPYSRTGNIALVCVWPALTLHSGGPIVSKGFALPQ